MSKMVSDVDQVATKLLDLGLSARFMAPAWAKAGIRQPAMGPDGQFVGWMLPGKGLLLDGLDKKRVGITRDMPYVYDYSPFARARDRLVRFGRSLHRSEVGAITTYDGIINARAGGKARDIVFNKSSITTAANRWSDAFTAAGSPPAGTFLATTAPTDALTDSATTGALQGGAMLDPGGTDKAYLLTLGFSSTSAHFFALLVDRGVQGGSYRLSVTTAETVASPKTITRDYGGGVGAGAQIVGTITTARATPGAGTLTITYLDQGGGSSTTPANAMLANADIVGTCIAGSGPTVSTGSPFIQLAAGDYGVKQVSQSQRAATADTTGVMALSIVQPLVWIPAMNTASVYVERDLPSDISGLMELANVSQVTGCLGVLVNCNAASLGTLLGFIRTAQG